MIAAASAVAGGGGRGEERDAVAVAEQSQDAVDEEAEAEREAAEEAERKAAEEAEAAAKAEEERLAEEQRLADEAAAAAAEAAEAARIGSVAQQNAYRTAVSYLDFSAFSRSGLAHQLEFEGYSAADAEFALARLEAEGSVDWNAQAAAKAASYLEFMAFSHAGLVEQLVFEGFSPEQAEYGVSTTGL
ncbi:hypothetical protein HLB10_11220 [Cellulomonas fimi]|nr:hypothetical protein [Cellulomonas fimi]